MCTRCFQHCGDGLQVGPEQHVICALSGGVDSTVAATLVHKVRSSMGVTACTELGSRVHMRCKMMTAMASCAVAKLC
jgi:GMP synthase PP-ATPase subunit